MENIRPHSINKKTTWNLNLEQANSVWGHIRLIEENVAKMKEVWRTIRTVDAGDGRDATINAFASLEQPEQNKALAYALYALHAEFILHLNTVFEEVSNLHNPRWEELFQPFTDTAPDPNRDTQ